MNNNESCFRPNNRAGTARCGRIDRCANCPQRVRTPSPPPVPPVLRTPCTQAPPVVPVPADLPATLLPTLPYTEHDSGAYWLHYPVQQSSICVGADASSVGSDPSVTNSDVQSAQLAAIQLLQNGAGFTIGLQLFYYDIAGNEYPGAPFPVGTAPANGRVTIPWKGYLNTVTVNYVPFDADALLASGTSLDLAGAIMSLDLMWVNPPVNGIPSCGMASATCDGIVANIDIPLTSVDIGLSVLENIIGYNANYTSTLDNLQFIIGRYPDNVHYTQLVQSSQEVFVNVDPSAIPYETTIIDATGDVNLSYRAQATLLGVNQQNVMVNDPNPYPRPMAVSSIPWTVALTAATDLGDEQITLNFTEGHMLPVCSETVNVSFPLDTGDISGGGVTTVAFEYHQMTEPVNFSVTASATYTWTAADGSRTEQTFNGTPLSFDVMTNTRSEVSEVTV